MSALLDFILRRIDDLPDNEREILIKRLQEKPLPPPNNEIEAKLRYRRMLIAKHVIPHPETEQEYQWMLHEMLTPEQIERLGTIDFDSLPQGKKILSEMIIEDREDRL
jgi:hypothetical protein